MPERLLALAKSVLAVVAAIVGLALWGARLEYQVSRKANQAEVEMLQQGLEAKLDRVTESQLRAEAMLVRYICSERPRDSACGR